MPIWESGSVLGSRDKKVNRIRHGLFLPGINILLTEKHMNYGIIQMSLTIHWGEGRGGEKRRGTGGGGKNLALNQRDQVQAFCGEWKNCYLGRSRSERGNEAEKTTRHWKQQSPRETKWMGSIRKWKED